MSISPHEIDMGASRVLVALERATQEYLRRAEQGEASLEQDEAVVWWRELVEQETDSSPVAVRGRVSEHVARRKRAFLARVALVRDLAADAAVRQALREADAQVLDAARNLAMELEGGLDSLRGESEDMTVARDAEEPREGEARIAVLEHALGLRLREHLDAWRETLETDPLGAEYAAGLAARMAEAALHALALRNPGRGLAQLRGGVWNGWLDEMARKRLADDMAERLDRLESEERARAVARVRQREVERRFRLSLAVAGVPAARVGLVRTGRDVAALYSAFDALDAEDEAGAWREEQGVLHAAHCAYTELAPLPLVRREAELQHAVARFAPGRVDESREGFDPDLDGVPALRRALGATLAEDRAAMLRDPSGFVGEPPEYVEGGVIAGVAWSLARQAEMGAGLPGFASRVLPEDKADALAKAWGDANDAESQQALWQSLEPFGPYRERVARECGMSIPETESDSLVPAAMRDSGRRDAQKDVGPERTTAKAA